MCSIVKCQIRGKIFKIEGEKYFRYDHCQIAFDIGQCLVKKLKEKGEGEKTSTI